MYAAFEKLMFFPIPGVTPQGCLILKLQTVGFRSGVYNYIAENLVKIRPFLLTAWYNGDFSVPWLSQVNNEWVRGGWVDHEGKHSMLNKPTHFIVRRLIRLIWFATHLGRVPYTSGYPSGWNFLPVGFRR